MRIYVVGIVAASLAACASPDHRVDANGDLLSAPNGANSLGEQIIAEGQGDGCLVAGNAGRNRGDNFLGSRDSCRALRDAIAPPEPPPGVDLAPPAMPQPLPTASDQL